MNVPISVDQLVFKQIIKAPLKEVFVPVVSGPVPSLESVPLSKVPIELGSKGGSAEGSFPWGGILVEVGVLIVVGVVLYQVEKRNEKLVEDRFR